MKYKNLLLSVGSVGLVVPAISSVVSCSFSAPSTPNPDYPNNDDSSDSSDNNTPSTPVLPDYSDKSEVITQLPKLELNDNTKIVPFYQLVKYTLQIPLIEIDGKKLSVSEQRQRYVEILNYISGDANKFTSVDNPKANTFGDVALRTWGREDQIFQTKIPEYASYDERFFWNDNEQWRDEFAHTMPETDQFVASTIAIPYYIQCQNMIQVSKFCFYYSWYKIQLIDAANQRGSAKDYFKQVKTYNAYQAAKKALENIQKYLNPLTGQQMMSSDPDNGLFGSFSYYNISAKGNMYAYRLIVDVVNRELAPFVYALGGHDSVIPANTTYRNWGEVFAKVAGQKVKYLSDWTEEELNQFWTRWFNAESKAYGWSFDTE